MRQQLLVSETNLHTLLTVIYIRKVAFATNVCTAVDQVPYSGKFSLVQIFI